MAEGIKPRAKRVRAGRAPTTPDPIEIAMEAERADRSTDSPARELLRKQGRLIDQQFNHLRLQIVSERLSAGLKMLLGVAGLVVAFALGLMVWDASQDRSLVIKALHAPPALEAQGLTGEVLASKLLDKLAVIDATAQSLRAPETFRNDWGSDIQVEIPQTGVSIGELNRYLRQWLGNRTEIGGEVVLRGEALALTVRVGSMGTAEAVGPEAELDALLQRLAEGVFERTQPFRYSKYLERSGRRDEAMAVAVRLAEDGPDGERPWAWAQISNLNLISGDIAAAAAAGRRSVALDPDQGLGWLNLAIAEELLGHSAAAGEANRRAVAVLTAGRGQLSREGVALGFANDAAGASRVGDYREAARLRNRREARVNYVDLSRGQRTSDGATLIALHEVTRGLRHPALLVDAHPGNFTNQYGNIAMPRASAAIMLEDWVSARRRLEATLASARAVGPSTQIAAMTHIESLLAVAEARTGDLDAARARVAAMPDDCDPCVRAKAWVAFLSGERAEAERLFALEARRTPASPFPLVHWARSRLERGDPAGALPLLRRATELGPRWADPFKFHGDALMRLGRTSEAVEAYREAIERAPRWGGAHLGLGRALAAKGDQGEAMQSYATATGLDLTVNERSLLNRLRP